MTCNETVGLCRKRRATAEVMAGDWAGFDVARAVGAKET